MLPEIGLLLLILALCTSALLTVMPALGVFRNDASLMATARPLAIGQLVFVLVAYVLLTVAFVTDDFSVAIVAAQSNTQLPLPYKFSAVWGGHEGSLLLWIVVLCLWTLAVAVFSKTLPRDMLARVLSIMGAISVGFLAFSLFTSSPFERLLLSTPPDGQDLNPLLQDPGMVIHPPMLYFGYVGFSVAFAFAIAALWSGKLDASWARWSRPWTTLAWVFLTAGITLGSWWAYYELGWGGWWFWDPVENASFMPWLVGTALIHSLAVTEKRGAYRSWTVLLAIFAFSLSLLGTFLVRSGVLTSVHAFAADPARGMFILGFLVIVVGGSLLLFALRAPTVKSSITFNTLSRESLLLANNVLLIVAALAVLLGTLYPLVLDFLGFGKYSVGPPYFNLVFVPLMAILACFMGLGPSTNWKKFHRRAKPQLLVAGIASAVIGIAFSPLYGGSFNVWVFLGVLLGSWIISTTLVNAYDQTRNASSVFSGLRRLSPSYYAMMLAHIGFAVTLLGVVLTSHYSIERDQRMVLGETAQISDLEVTFEDLSSIEGPNYRGQRGEFSVIKEGDQVADIAAEKRRYHARGTQVMTEAGIDASLMRDVYIALGESLGENAWAVRLNYKAFVRWLWLGGALMALGGLLAVADKRYRNTAGKGALL